MRDLAVQASNDGSQDANAKAASQQEFSELNDELDRIASKTTFNGQALLDGTFTSKNFQVGYAAGDTIAVSIDAADSTTLATNGLDLTTGASAAITAVDAAIKTVSTTRATLGATQNRFEHVINSVNVAVENLSASESAIRDTDMAQEMTSFTRAQILSQAGTSMLAQANQSSQSVLKLLG
jgi:flagellin